MGKNSGIWVMVLVLVASFLLCGCETIRGAGEGLAYTVNSAGQGLAKDTKKSWNFIQDADEWMKANLW